MPCFLFDWISAWRFPERSLEIHTSICLTVFRRSSSLRFPQHSKFRNRVYEQRTAAASKR